MEPVESNCIATPRQCVQRTIAVHIGFHALWTAVFIAGLVWPAMIPMAPFYTTFVLGPLNALAHGSMLLVMTFGFGLFAVSGLISGAIMAESRPRESRLLLLASCSVLGWVLVFMGVSILTLVL